MEELLVRLSELDADAANAVRVIIFFDTLVDSRADLDTLLRHTARLAERPAGLITPGRGLALRAEPDGSLRPSEQAPGGAAVQHLDGGATVWLGHIGQPLPLDGILLERFALAATALMQPARTLLPELGDPALVELALSGAAGQAERSRALHLLGLAPTTPVRVLAVAGNPAPVIAALGDRARTRSASLGRLHAVISTIEPVEPGALPPPARVGVGRRLPAIDAPDSWYEAKTALRTATDDQPTAWAEQLGGVLALARHLTPEAVADVPDVTMLDNLAARFGTEMLRTVNVVCATGSTRRAATALRCHHSSVAYRLRQAETILGFRLTTPAGLFRLTLALLLRQLRDTPDQTWGLSNERPCLTFGGDGR